MGQRSIAVLYLRAPLCRCISPHAHHEIRYLLALPGLLIEGAPQELELEGAVWARPSGREEVVEEHILVLHFER